MHGKYFKIVLKRWFHSIKWQQLHLSLFEAVVPGIFEKELQGFSDNLVLMFTLFPDRRLCRQWPGKYCGQRRRERRGGEDMV